MELIHDRKLEKPPVYKKIENSGKYFSLKEYVNSNLVIVLLYCWEHFINEEMVKKH
jgi:hypothetical protein